MGVVAEPPASRMIQPRSGQETLPAHLEARYGIQVGAMTELDWPGTDGPGTFRTCARCSVRTAARSRSEHRPIAMESRTATGPGHC